MGTTARNLAASGALALALGGAVSLVALAQQPRPTGELVTPATSVVEGTTPATTTGTPAPTTTTSEPEHSTTTTRQTPAAEATTSAATRPRATLQTSQQPLPLVPRATPRPVSTDHAVTPTRLTPMPTIPGTTVQTGSWATVGASGITSTPKARAQTPRPTVSAK